MTLRERLLKWLCNDPGWFWSGNNGYEFAAGDGTWPIDMLLEGKLRDMVYDKHAENTWPELDNSETYYAHLWDGKTVWEIRMKGHKQAFVWATSRAMYGADGHPHPDKGAFWIDIKTLTQLWRAIRKHRKAI